MKTTKQDAQAKSKLLLLALRAAAQAHISAQAQGLLAVLIAEAWPADNGWSAKLGVELLAERFDVSRFTVGAWAKQLERSQIIRRKIGSPGRVTEWKFARFVEGCASATQPLRQRNTLRSPAPHEPLRPRNTDSVISNSVLVQSQPAKGSLDERAVKEGETDRTLPPLHECLPGLSRYEIAIATKSESTRRIIRNKAAAGDQQALDLLQHINELKPISECLG